MRRSPLSWLVILLGLVASPASALVEFYVDPRGDDAADGTRDRPFATLVRARDAARNRVEKQGGKPSDPVTVILRTGTYFLAEPLVLTPADSFVTFAALENEKPVVSGGRRVTGWRKTQLDGKEAWGVTLAGPGMPGPLRSLWVNGRRAVRARHPNVGYFKVAEVPGATSDWMKGQDNFRFAEGDLQAWPGLEKGAEIVVASRWVESRLPVTGLDPAARTIRFGKKSVWTLEPGDRYWAEGNAAWLDQPGEWHYDGAASTLYYLPRPGEDMTTAEAIVPAISQVVRLEGKPGEGQGVEHVTFRGIGFSHTDWGQGWAGWDEKRSGFGQAAIGVPAAVHGDGVRHCTFDRCTFAHVGTYALELGRGSQHNRVTHCTFTDLGAGGIKIGETVVRDSEADQTFDNEVSDCRLTDGGNLFPSCVAVWVGQSRDNRLVHNEIADFYYTGFSVGWTWGYGKSGARGNVIGHNHVHHLGKRSDQPEPILSDMGGIYTLGIQPGTVVRNNRFHDIEAAKYGGWGIYFDEGTSQVVAENNVVYRTTHGGFHQHYGRDNVFRNNILAFGRDVQVQRTRPEPHRSFTFERNVVYWDRGEALGGSWDNCNVLFDRNVYWKAGGGAEFKPPGMTLAQWHEKGMDAHSVVADPKFVSLDKDDFNLRDDSPARDIGFEPFDPSDVGPRTGPP